MTDKIASGMKSIESESWQKYFFFFSLLRWTISKCVPMIFE